MYDILRERVELLMRYNADSTLQAIEKALCKADILYFFRNYLYTDKNTTLFYNDEPSVIPFIPFAFQEELITEVWASIVEGTKPISQREDFTNVFIEKSRQMWVSRVLVGIFVYGWLFHDHKYLMISQKEDDVDKLWDMKSLFEKVRFIIKNLPQWMLPEWFSKKSDTPYNKRMLISKPNSSASISGESANPNAGRWGTYNAVFLDEMAFQSNAAAINTSCASTTPCRIFNSTPNWEGNEFYRMRKLTMDRKDENGNFLPAEIKWLRYHWTEHPIYCQYPGDMRWYNQKVKWMSKEQIAQELEINYNVSIKGRVYPSITGDTWDVQYDPLKQTFIVIDNSHWGTDPHAVIIAQRDPKTHYIDIIDCIEMNADIISQANFMAKTVKIDLNHNEYEFMERYREYDTKRATFISDPYDTNTTIKNIHNPQWVVIKEEYRKVGIYLNTPSRSDPKTRIMNTQSNIYRMRVAHRCIDFLSAIQNARYPEVTENSSRTSPALLPIHDWTSHYRTALEYLFAWILENEWKPVKKEDSQVEVKRDKVTGKLIYTSKK